MPITNNILDHYARLTQPKHAQEKVTNNGKTIFKCIY